MKTTKFFKMDLDNGEGEFKLTNEFKSEPPLLKLDIMKDWLVMLKKEYNITIDEFQNELSKIEVNK